MPFLTFTDIKYSPTVLTLIANLAFVPCSFVSAQVEQPGQPLILAPVAETSGNKGFFALPPTLAPNTTLLSIEDKARAASKNRTGGMRVGAVVSLPT
eukprot:UC4_evm1s1368